MKDDETRRSALISLEDQAFLKSIGISGLAPGAEFALREHDAALAAQKRIEARADGLLGLDLGARARSELERDGIDGDDLSFFRDLDGLSLD